MKVSFYRHGTNHHGYFVQRENLDKTADMTKKQIFEIADLRHPILTKEEFFEVLSTDINGKKRKCFELLSRSSPHILIITS